MKIKELARVFWQSLFLQANWNYEAMQNIGFLTSLLPQLPQLTKDKEEQKQILKRHLQYFNTQPYFASVIIGSTLAQEHDRINSGLPQAEDIIRAKQNMMGPFAALGDSLFWGTLKPFTGMVAVFLILINKILWAPLVFLFLYNVPHLFLRLHGLRMGYRKRLGVVQTVFKYRCQTLIKTIKMMGLIFLGGSLPVFSSQIDGVFSPYADFYLQLLSFTVLTLGLAFLLRRGFSPQWLLLGLLLICFFMF